MEIGLFPLGMVLVPGEHAPLHIFEDRYKELIEECLARDVPFGLVFADDDGVRSIGTTAAVSEVLARFPDGRMNVVVEGRERFRIVRLTEGRSFATAEIEAFPDIDAGPPSEEAVGRCMELYRSILEAAGAESGEPDPGVPSPSFHIAGRVDLGPEPTQQLLETRSERERVTRLAELLEDAMQTLRLHRLARERAAGDGKVERP